VLQHGCPINIKYIQVRFQRRIAVCADGQDAIRRGRDFKPVGGVGKTVAVISQVSGDRGVDRHCRGLRQGIIRFGVVTDGLGRKSIADRIRGPDARIKIYLDLICPGSRLG